MGGSQRLDALIDRENSEAVVGSDRAYNYGKEKQHGPRGEYKEEDDEYKDPYRYGGVHTSRSVAKSVPQKSTSCENK